MKLVKQTLLSGVATISAVIGWMAPVMAQDVDSKPINSSAASMPSQASESPPAASGAEIGDIVVTAQKRSQSLSKIGLTITAATGEQLQNAGVTDIKSLMAAVPAFSVTSSLDGLPVFSIRGMGFIASQLAAAPTVSVYTDEAPLPYSAMTGGVVLDLERVEVLKGPQGTLFGNNSSAGSINFIAAKPTSTFTAGFRVSVDRFGRVEPEGFVSGPLSDTLRIRAAANTSQFGAWQRTYTNGPQPTGANVGPRLKNGDANKGAERVILDWQPSSGTKLSLNLNHYYDKSEPQLPQFSSSAPGRPIPNIDPVTGYTIATYPLPPKNNRAADFNNTTPTVPGIDLQKLGRNDEFYQAILRGEFDLTDDVKLVTITNYAHLSTALFRDADSTRIDAYYLGHNGTIRTISQELRLVGDFPEAGIKAIAGLNYADDKISETEPFLLLQYSLFPGINYFDPYADSRNKTAAAFVNLDYELTSNLTVLGGVRYTRMRQDYVACNVAQPDGSAAAFVGSVANALREAVLELPPTDAYVPGACATLDAISPFDGSNGYLPAPPFAASSVDHNVSWRAGVNYQATPNLLAYGLVSRGYKAGAYPFSVNVLQSQYNKVEQEKVTSYEAGLKYASRYVSLSTAGFYYDYIDKQVYTLIAVPIFGTLNQLANIPKSKVYGFELEGTVVPFDGLRLHSALTYSKSEILDPGPVQIDANGNPVDLRGHPFAYAPKLSVVFDGEYRFDLSDQMQMVFGGNGVYNSRQFGTLDSDPAFAVKSYWVFDARVGIESSKGWSLTAWVRNLTDEYYFTDANYVGDNINHATGLPRNFGLTAAFKF